MWMDGIRMVRYLLGPTLRAPYGANNFLIIIYTISLTILHFGSLLLDPEPPRCRWLKFPNALHLFWNALHYCTECSRNIAEDVLEHFSL